MRVKSVNTFYSGYNFKTTDEIENFNIFIRRESCMDKRAILLIALRVIEIKIFKGFYKLRQYFV